MRNLNNYIVNRVDAQVDFLINYAYDHKVMMLVETLMKNIVCNQILPIRNVSRDKVWAETRSK